MQAKYCKPDYIIREKNLKKAVLVEIGTHEPLVTSSNPGRFSSLNDRFAGSMGAPAAISGNLLNGPSSWL
jgi:hypothetical protein